MLRDEKDSSNIWKGLKNSHSNGSMLDPHEFLGYIESQVAQRAIRLHEEGMPPRAALASAWRHYNSEIATILGNHHDNEAYDATLRVKLHQIHDHVRLQASMATKLSLARNIVPAVRAINHLTRQPPVIQLTPKLPARTIELKPKNK